MKLYYETELSHHGIKGQKWGVRRFQNKDGTLTSKGKKRYRTDYETEAKNMTDDELRSRIARLTNEKRYMDLTKKESRFANKMGKLQRNADLSSKSTKVRQNAAKIKGDKSSAAKLGTAKQGMDAVSKSAAVAAKVSKMATEPKHVKRSKKVLENLNDDDLKKIVARLDLEKQYSQISRESARRGKITTDQIIDVVGDTLTIAASVTGILVGIKTLQKMGGVSGLPV